MFRSIVFLVLFMAGGAFGQRLGVGVKAGARLSGDIDSYFAKSESKRYVVGPMLELRLPHGFGIEFDALYRRFGYLTSDGGFWGSYVSQRRANVWEFPILAKYRLPVFRRLQPFASVGYAPRRISGKDHSEGDTIDYNTGARTPSAPYDSAWHPYMTHGVVAAGGVEFGGTHMRFAPEFRYTRWNKDPIAIYGSHGYFISGNPNQMEILVGVSWH